MINNHIESEKLIDYPNHYLSIDVQKSFANRIENLVGSLLNNINQQSSATLSTRTVSSISSSEEESGLGSTESAALLSGSRATSQRIENHPAANQKDLVSHLNDQNSHQRQRGWTERRQSSKSFFSTCMAWSECFGRIFRFILRKKSLKPRLVHIQSSEIRSRKNEFPANIVRNQKYNIITFLPIVLFNQFKFFLNLYFLLMACSQFFDPLKVGPIFTYWAPLGFVLGVTLIREMIDDILRYKRDKAVNSQFYTKISKIHGAQAIPSAKIRVGDIIQIYKDQRVPADMIFLRTSEKNGACFIRTDQLDGETDWKLRLAVTTTQELENNEDIFELDALLHVEEPRKDIHSFVGKFINNSNGKESPLSIENTFWANTVVASGTAIGIVIYTGPETRSMMNNNEPRSKVGLLDYEVNELTKLLFAAVVILAFAMICLKGFSGYWYIYWFRYVLLFSYIIPISLRVNLEMGRVVYCQMIQRDMEIAGTLARTTTIPEDLGRIAYLLTDKTGTLTKNEMIFKKIHFGRISYSQEYFEEVAAMLRAYYNQSQNHQNSSDSNSGGYVANYRTHRRESSTASTSSFTVERRRHMRIDSYEVDREIVYRVQQAVLAIALCHNVTPAYDNHFKNDDPNSVNIQMKNISIMYHASSPDEVALVQWTEKVGMTLIFRDIKYIKLRNPYGQIMNFEILDIFPFSSETKRMGIIVKDLNSKEIVFYLKGADTVMSSIITYSDWLQEQCDNMARSGLRTLIVAKKILTDDQFQDFQDRYNQAKCNMNDRSARIRTVLATLEKDMELLCLTGVEDRLQEGVATTLKGLQDAGIKLWMLTGDKLETAISIAKSSQLVKKMQEFYVFRPVKNRNEVHLELNNFHRKSDCPLVIRGEDLELCMKFYSAEFMDLATQCPAVVCCRCSPTQKAEVVKMIQLRTGKRTCAVGDGGNDVSMIQTANVGIGIVGKEGQQASLAADFSILQFSNIYRLILLHGRYSYKRSASLSQFIIHRGLIISTLQAIFSSAFYFASVPLYQGFLMIGYATFYTMFPVFSIVLDKDVSPRLVMKFPELYQLMKGRSLSYKTFFIWVLISIYQGSVIMYGSILLFNDEFIHVVAITFTAVILTELLMLALTVRTWHWLMIVAELTSFSSYLLTLILAPQFFDEKFIQSRDFLWKVTLMTLISCLPLYLLKFLHRKIAPPSHQKLT
ncbi:putative phospholipid-transporting ATPase IIB [Sarcoptes scabiei]|nr:putative phospholipid-transporting ATPase IIB [Sarcoptes scabiei]